ncbi:MAG: Gfo/Idh/MocA family protein, partial [Planctomycetota bacterium]
SGAVVAAVCDVDERALGKGVAAVEKATGKAPRTERDLRRLLDDKSIDILVVAAPNHWHAPATILGCAAGKHVYVEKPCSHNPREGECRIEHSTITFLDGQVMRLQGAYGFRPIGQR